MKIYCIEEVFIVAESKKDAIEKYLERQLGINGEDIPEFDENNIADALTFVFKEIADRLGGVLGHSYTSITGLKCPKIDFQGYPFGSSLSLEVDDDRFMSVNEGYVIKLVLRGKEENETYISVINYSEDPEVILYEVREEANRLLAESNFMN